MFYSNNSPNFPIQSMSTNKLLWLWNLDMNTLLIHVHYFLLIFFCSLCKNHF